MKEIIKIAFQDMLNQRMFKLNDVGLNFWGSVHSNREYYIYSINCDESITLISKEHDFLHNVSLTHIYCFYKIES